MSRPEFVFSHKTCELSRGGKMIALSRAHADIFACLAAAQGLIGCGAIAKAIDLPDDVVEDELSSLARRLKPLGIAIASERGRGKWLVFEDVPKWQPNIPPPAVLEGEQR